MEKEALVVIWACDRFHYYLSGLESFQLVTDFKALEGIIKCFIFIPNTGENYRNEQNQPLKNDS